MGSAEVNIENKREFPLPVYITYKSLRLNRMIQEITERILQIAEGLLQIFPDAIFWGTGFIAFVTLSYPFGVFFVSMIEGTAIYHGLNILNENLQIFSRNTLSSGKCRTGFADVTLRSISIFDREFKPNYLSASLFITSYIAAYVVGILMYLKDELEILGDTNGEEYDIRKVISIIFFITVIFILMSYRLYNRCDSPVNIVVSVLLGFIFGALIVYQNSKLFGKQSLNLLGIPLLRKKTAEGEDLYVCSPT